MKVPLLDLQAQYGPIRDELLEALTRVCDSQRFIMGPEVEALERELAQMLDVGYAVALSSGTDALLAAMMALDIGPGDEVVTTTYSFFATAGSVARLQARPVLVDIDPVTFNIDNRAVEAAITTRTRAIIPVHLYGLSAEMDPLLEMADRGGIPVIEDAAQAIGATYRGRPVGGFGAAACFSFFPSKNLGAFGDGGLLTTNDEQFALRVRSLRNHGAEPKYFHKEIGGNFRLDALQAAVLRTKVPHLRGWTEGRRRNAERYGELFQEYGLTGKVGIPIEPAGYYHVYNQFVIRVPRRDELRRHLEQRGVGTEIYYPVPFHLQECFRYLGYGEGAFPVAERAAAETLALPVYAELTAEQQRHVVSCIREFFESGEAVVG
jgi:dTDP-4-amino-4,6-dideoxygalactose transaminase